VRAVGSRIFLSGQAVSLLGDGLAVLAIPLLVLRLTHSPLLAALASAPRTIGYLLVGLPSGPIVDRADPWLLLVAMDVVRAAIFVALFLLGLAHVRSVAVILVLAMAAAGAGVFFESALTVAVRDVFTGPDLIRANSFLEMAGQTSVVIGPAVVGVLAAGLGVDVALLIDAATFVVSLATLFAVRRDRAGPAQRAGGALWTEFRAGLAYIARTRLILTLVIVQAVINLCLAVEKLIIFFAGTTLGLTAPRVSLAVIGGGAGGVAGALTARRIVTRLGALPLVASCLALIGVALAVMGAAADVWWLAASNLVLVWATVVANIVLRTLRQQIVPRRLLGRVTSTVRTICLALTPVGAVVAGALTAALGGDPRPVFLGAGLLIVVTAVIAWAVALRHQARGLPARGVDVRAGPDGHVEHDGLGEGRMHAVDLLDRGSLGSEVVAGGGDDDRGEGE
jgi:Major Facilitator Superfamily